jgi:hypothetical protein
MRISEGIRCFIAVLIILFTCARTALTIPKPS